MPLHRLDPTADTVVDVFSRDAPPVLTVDPGERLVVRSLDASGYLQRQAHPGQRAPRLLPDSRGHCLTGPIAVRGASPGSVLAVHVAALHPDDWGWTVAGGPDHPSWLLWQIADDVATNQHGHRVPVAPFLGVVGVAPAEAGEHSTIPPRPGTGGNVDCRELVAGSTLYLPVQVEGALLSLGDGHAAQGDGEVGGTAVECAMTTEVVVDLVTDPPVPTIHAETPTGRITFGFDADLNAASTAALEAMLTWLQALRGLDRTTALALASTCVDLRVTQVANATWGVHAMLAHDRLLP